MQPLPAAAPTMHAAAAKHQRLSSNQTAVYVQRRKEERKSYPRRKEPDQSPIGAQSLQSWRPGKDVQAAVWPAAAAERLMHASEASGTLPDGRGPVNPAQPVHPRSERLRNGSCRTAGLPERAVRLSAAEGCSSGPEDQRLNAAASQKQQKPEKTELHMDYVQLSFQLCPAATHADVQSA